MSSMNSYLFLIDGDQFFTRMVASGEDVVIDKSVGVTCTGREQCNL